MPQTRPLRPIFCLMLVALLGGCQTSLSHYYNHLFNKDQSAAPVAVSANPDPKAHESWCYRTLGKVDCYDRPQSGDATRLVGVDPPARMPLTRDEYADDTIKAAMPAKSK